MTSDRGPNEVMAKKMWMVRARNAPGIVCLTADCNEHLAHLITLQSLKSVDGYLKRHGRPWKLFASVATSSNTFRDLSKSIFEEWSNIHGDESAMKHAKKLWPKCIGGRWNSVHEVLCRMVKVGGQTMVLPVLEKILQKKAPRTKKGVQGEDVSKLPENDASRQQAVDELSYDQTKEYQRKMGLWRSNTLMYVQDPLWWVLGEGMRVSTATLMEFSVP